MICCLNPDCHNPPCPDDTKFCLSCGTPLVLLRRYRPIQQLSSGGFGKTYLAEDIDKFNERCVIKQFAPQAQGTGALRIATRLFEDEARRLQQLGEHPQIPTLFAYFEQDSQLYLVQQYIEGQNLRDELELEGLSNEQKIRELLLELLDILKFVHQQNVIHRDIKPENIIRRRGDGKLVLIDFGASKQLSATVSAKQGTKIGSFGYASLEQMENRQVYPASDLYSLGATCFHLLSGVKPWELWKKQGYSWVSNWQLHLRQPVSQELECILDKVLQEDYQQRYQSAEEILQDLHSQAPLPPNIPSPVTTPPQASPQLPAVSAKGAQLLLPSRALAQWNAKFKNSLVVGGAILMLGSGGYGVLHIKTYLPVNVAYEKLALANTLTGHTDSVDSLAFSADGQTIVSGSGDNTIKIWNLRTGQLTTTLTEPYSVVGVAISPDGQTLASGGNDVTVKIWNLQTGQLNTTLIGHTATVRSVAISPDGQTLVSGSADNTIKVWNLQTGQLNATLTGHTDSVRSVVISADGQTIVSGSADKTIKVWNLKTGQLNTTLTGHLNWVNCVAISADGQTLVSGSGDKSIKIWNLKTGQLNTTLTGHTDSVDSLAISAHGQTLASGSNDMTLKIWNLKTGQLNTTLTGHTDSVDSLTMSPDGQMLVSGSKDKTIKIWRVPK